MIREYIIKISDEVLEDEFGDRPKEIVRCKDCKFGSEPIIYGRGLWCSKLQKHFGSDWYCADGEHE